MTKLRKSAKGRECQIRIYGVCNHNRETTVLAHLGGGGMGAKQPDIHGAFACSACHDEVDRRTHRISRDEARLAHLEGIIRTQRIWLEEGLL